MYLTFDVGTTSVKTALFNQEGRRLAKVIKDYRLESPYVDWYELNPEIYWSSVMDGFKEVIDMSGVRADQIKSISGCSQGETFILLDRNDRPLRPAIVWYDNRAREEVEEIKGFIETPEYYAKTGLLEMETTASAFKLLWVRKNEPDVFNSIQRMLLVEDYIIYRLTGEYVSTPSMLCSTALIDIVKKEYWKKMVAYIGIEEWLPKMVDEACVVGTVVPEVRDQIGLKKDVIVVKGSMDQITSAIGAGNIKPGIVTETTGSALAVVVTADTFETDGSPPLPYQVHALRDKYAILPYAQTAGIVYKWFRENVLTSEHASSDAINFDTLNSLAAMVEAGSEGLVFLPFLAGAHFPENDTFAKGVVYGITLKHNRSHFCRAIMESIGYMLKNILLHVEKFGMKVEEIHSMGGAARSDLWMQIKSDICNIPMVRMEEEETSTLGAAILASLQTQDYNSVEEAVAAMVKRGGGFEPELKNREVYERMFALYRELYQNLKKTYRNFNVG